VRGLAINFGSSGITLSVAGHDIVEGNFIGTDTTGTDDRGNGFNGVDITKYRRQIELEAPRLKPAI